MKNRNLFLICFLLVSHPMFAAVNPQPQNPQWQGRGPHQTLESNPQISLFVTTALHFLDFSSLNAALSGESFPQLADAPLNYSVGSVYSVSANGFFSGYDLNWLIKAKGESGAVLTELKAFYATFFIGYDFFKENRNVVLAPFAGAGFGRMKLLAGGEEFSFSDELSTANSSVFLKQNNWLFQAGIQLSFSEDVTAWGIRAGYHYQPPKTDWKSGLSIVNDGPNINWGGFYIQLAIGFTG